MEISKNCLTASDVYKSYCQGEKKIHVLCGITATFEQGKSYAITGVSGSGKSTLIHILGGLDEPSSGHVLYNDHNIFKFRASQKNFFHNGTIGFVFQFHYLIKELSVLENVMIMGMIRGERRDVCKKRAFSLLDRCGIGHKTDAYPTQLSGGQQQRVAIARAMFNKPAFLLADEPTGNLDEETAKQITSLFFEGQKEWGMGIILCSHDSEVYGKMETVYRLHDGILVEKK